MVILSHTVVLHSLMNWICTRKYWALALWPWLEMGCAILAEWD